MYKTLEGSYCMKYKEKIQKAFDLYCLGKSVSQIAKELRLSKYTVYSESAKHEFKFHKRLGTRELKF